MAVVFFLVAAVFFFGGYFFVAVSVFSVAVYVFLWRSCIFLFFFVGVFCVVVFLSGCLCVFL